MNFLHITGHILVEVGFDVNSPLMSMAVFFSLLSKIPGNVPVHNGFDYGYTLKRKTYLIGIDCIIYNKNVYRVGPKSDIKYKSGPRDIPSKKS